MSHLSFSPWTHGTLALLVMAGIVPFCVNLSRDGTGVVYQTGENDCAPAAVTMLLEATARSVSVDQVRSEFQLHKDGATVSQVVEVLRAHGLWATAWEFDRTRIEDVPVPSILFVDGSHFLVLDSVVESTIYVRDPASGRQKLSIQELHDRWDGVTVTVPHRTSEP